MRRHADPLSGSGEKRRNLNQRLRMAFIAGAEDRSRSVVGRSLTDEELRRILVQYPGDLPSR